MKIRLGIEKNVEKIYDNTFGNRKKRRKKNEKKMKKKRKKNEKKMKKTRGFFTFFGFFKNLLKIGHFGGLRPEPKNEKK